MQSALAKVKGVSNAKVSLSQKAAVVQVDSSVSSAELIKAVKAAGFGATEKAMEK